MRRLSPRWATLLFAAMLACWLPWPVVGRAGPRGKEPSAAGSRPAVARSSADEYLGEYVLPILKQNCYECHSHAGGKAKGGLVLDCAAGGPRGAIQDRPSCRESPTKVCSSRRCVTRTWKCLPGANCRPTRLPRWSWLGFHRCPRPAYGRSGQHFDSKRHGITPPTCGISASGQCCARRK